MEPANTAPRTGAPRAAVLWLSGCLLLLLCLPSAAAAAPGHVLPTRPAPAPSLAGATASSAAVVSAPASGGTARAWSRRQMLRARPPVATGPPPDAGAHSSALAGAVANPVAATGVSIINDPVSTPLTTAGRLFFRLGDEDQPGGNEFACSATVVNSLRRNVVITAGHCVVEPPGIWATDIVFVPAYSDGAAPLGQYPAVNGSVITTRAFRDNGDQRFDIAAVALADGPAGPVENTTGARKIEFGTSPAGRPLRIFGYPVTPSPPFDGEKLVRCIPAYTGIDPNLGSPPTYGAEPCNMAHGASGGGWIVSGRYLISVVSYGYCGDSDPPVCRPELYGPQLRGNAAAVYSHPAIGGSANPTVKLARAVPRKMRKRWLNIRVAGSGSTPVVFKVRLDRQAPVFTGAVIKARNLTRGRHRIWIRSVDQTGHLSPRVIRRDFRVLPRKKATKKRRARRR